LEYPFALPAVRNWRTAALVAAVVAAVELIILLALAVAAFGLPFAAERKALLAGEGNASARAEAPASTKQGKRAVPSPTLPRSETSVVVLNGNGVPGAADLASGKVRRLHYVVTGTANASRSDFRRTIIMFRPGFEGEARRLARDVGARRIAPLDGMRPSQLMGAHIALILGRR
jgi:LytR cell envelope-related transcriptional attenuator